MSNAHVHSLMVCNLHSFIHVALGWYNRAAAVVLCLFALLALLGVKESAKVALVIFTIHIITLTVLVLACAEWMYHGEWEVYHHNLENDDTSSDVAKKIFYGFGMSLLGITGFETSANYIEEQAPGVYPKTLRNMVCLSYPSYTTHSLQCLMRCMYVSPIIVVFGIIL
jgi:uncharacterized membrane protein YphA (DoxX/SURF4 family)